MNRGYGNGNGNYRGDYRAVPRTCAAPRYVGPRNGSGYSGSRCSSGRYYGPRYSGPSFRYSPRAFYRPSRVPSALQHRLRHLGRLSDPCYDPFYYPPTTRISPVLLDGAWADSSAGISWRAAVSLELDMGGVLRD